jgi:hypothetical protein
VRSPVQALPPGLFPVDGGGTKLAPPCASTAWRSRRTIDHVSQKSIDFADPDGNTLEIYDELPEALEMFARGREDRDVPLALDR